MAINILYHSTKRFIELETSSFESDSQLNLSILSEFERIPNQVE